MVKTNKNIHKSVDFSFFHHIFFSFIDDKKFLILIHNRQTRYFLVPDSIDFLTSENQLSFFCKDRNVEFNIFYSSVVGILKSFFFIRKKKLRLKGLGLKMNLSSNSDSSLIEFKLGFSHMISVSVPKQKIRIIIKKNILIVEGFNAIEVGNFINYIKSLRLPDIYKGRGFWGIYEKENLKAIKKK